MSARKYLVSVSLWLASGMLCLSGIFNIIHNTTKLQ